MPKYRWQDNVQYQNTDRDSNLEGVGQGGCWGGGGGLVCPTSGHVERCGTAHDGDKIWR